MTNQTTRILGIAPYEGMKLMMERLAKRRSDIDLTVHVGDLSKGVKIVQDTLSEDFDIIISRGGTAEMISNITDIPLVEISLSVYDIIRAIKLAENYDGKYAIVGYPSITSSAQLLCDLLQYDTDIHTVHNVGDVVNILAKLKDRGCQMILCDMITNTTAKQIGLNSILITSGDESIETAFDQALKLNRSYSRINDKRRLLNNIIVESGENIIVVDEHKQNIVTSVSSDLLDIFTSIINKEFNESQKNDQRKFIKHIGDDIYSVTSRQINSANRNYLLFRFEKTSTAHRGNRTGITYLNRSEIESSFYNSFYSIVSPVKELREINNRFSSSDSPILIMSEVGLSKATIAKAIYSSSKLSNNPFIMINCTSIDDKSWRFLMENYNSPMTDSNNTLFFNDLHKLTSERSTLLLNSILNMNVHVRNKVIFSFSTNEPSSNIDIANTYLDRLSCLALYVDPLREHIDDIPKISSLYINNLNLELAKQIIGFEPKAMTLMKNYSWPKNYIQFRRLLKEMASITDTSYILESTVRDTLAKETKLTTPYNFVPDQDDNFMNYSLDTNMTLNEITREIINIYVEKSNGNMGIASKRLGISRTTLWRYLK